MKFKRCTCICTYSLVHFETVKMSAHLLTSISLRYNFHYFVLTFLVLFLQFKTTGSIDSKFRIDSESLHNYCYKGQNILFQQKCQCSQTRSNILVWKQLDPNNFSSYKKGKKNFEVKRFTLHSNTPPYPSLN